MRQFILFGFIICLISMGGLQPRSVDAQTQACPANWVRVLTGKGVIVCGKKNARGQMTTYVQWIDLASGARIRNATDPLAQGSVFVKNPDFNKRTVQNWWSWAQNNMQNRPAGAQFSAVNGSFFTYWPGTLIATVSFPIRDQGQLLTVGDNNNTWSKRIFTIDSTGTRAWMDDTNSGSKDWNTVDTLLRYNWNAIWGYHPAVCTGVPNEKCVDIDKNDRIARTWIGLRDVDSNGRYKSVLILTTKAATQQETLDMLAKDWASPKNMQLDGSGSAQVVLRGTSYTPANTRTVPHAFIVYEAP